ncbi:MAG: PAS domain S-box protein [Deltaproteobacteria bacterium]|nr:PAS domain S-box protein [Deltaproteobacteria bacterium]
MSVNPSREADPSRELALVRDRLVALQGQEQALRSLLEHLPGVLWTTDRELRFTSSGGAALASIGLEPGQVIGLTLYDYFRTDDPSFPPIAAHLRALAGERASYEFEWRDHAFITYVEPLRATDGAVRGTIGLALDATDSDRAARTLRAAHDELERVASSRTAELSSANRRLEREIDHRRLHEARLHAVNRCLAGLGLDATAGLQRITVVAGETLGGMCAVFQRAEGERLVTAGTWNFSPGPTSAMPLEGTIVGELVRLDGEDRVVLRKLRSSGFVVTDPLVRDAGVCTVVAQVVRVGRQAVGALLVGYDEDRHPSGEDRELLAVLAAATGVQEERRAAEEALRGSEERYRRLVESLHDRLIYARRPDGRFTYTTPSSVDVVGYTPEEIIGHVEEHLTDSPVNREIERHQQVTNAGGHPPAFEVEFFHKDGSRRWLEVNEFPIRDEHGVVVGAEGLARDITEEKRREDELRESEERFRQLAENIDQVFWMTTVAKDRMLYVSPAYERIWGRTRDDLYVSALAWVDAVHPDDRERVLRGAMEEQAAGTYDHEYRVLRPDGTVRWIRDRAFPIRNARGEIYRIAGLAEDITERKRTEERVRSIVATALDAIITIDAAGVVHSFNPAAEQIFGYSASEVVGQSIRMLMPEEVAERAAELLRWYLRRGLGSIGEGTGRHKDGTIFPIELAVTALGTEDRRLFTGVVRDITRRKRAEAALVAASRMEATVTLAGGVAHDFNNLMAVVLTNTEILRRDLAERSEDLALVEEISDLARRGGDLAKQLVAFARGGKTRSVPVDLNNVVEEVLALQRRSIPRQVRMNVDLQRDLALIEADPTQMGQVVVNLSINAVEATGESGQVSIRTRNVEVDEEMARTRAGLRPGPYVCLTVRDEGAGMDAATVARVFEPFFTTKFHGRGLGLAAVYGIVKNHSGHVGVTSATGEGSTFDVFVPALPDLEP